MTKKLDGKVALITGGSSGLGLATAVRFIEEGARVFVTGRRQIELDAAVAQLGGKAVGICGDISKMADLDHLFAEIRNQAGRVDVLFANAGGGAFVPLGSITEAHFDKYFGINVKGTLFTVQTVLPLMPPGSAIILNGSVAASLGLPSFSVYSATKAALRSFARTWSVELREKRIRVNVVSPGTIVTPGYKSELGLTDEQIQGMVEQVAINAPLGRTGTPDEVAKAVVFLASDDSSYVTGIELFVDGGMGQV